MKAPAFVRCILLIALLVSCSDDDLRNIQKPRLDIGGAQTLTTVQEGTGQETTHSLFKITDSGSVEAVNFINPNGVEVDPSIAKIALLDRMMDINAEYLILTGMFFVSDTTGSLQTYQALLVRKTDGAVFDFGDDHVSHNPFPFGDPIIKHDAQGNIYYATNEGDVYKLSLDNPDAIGKVSYLPSGQKAIVSFGIDANGNCVYAYNDLRIKKVGGGIAELAVPGSAINGYWIGSNGAIYLLTTNDSDGSKEVYKATVVDNEVVIQNVWTPDADDLDNRPGEVITYKVSTQNSVVFLSNGSAWEFFENDNSIVAFDSPALEEQSVVVSSAGHYYIATGTNLYKVNILSHEYSQLIPSGAYEMYAMSVDDNDVLQFNGLRYSDGKKVFGEISASGELTVLDEELDRKATLLNRLF